MDFTPPGAKELVEWLKEHYETVAVDKYEDIYDFPREEYYYLPIGQNEQGQYLFVAVPWKNIPTFFKDVAEFSFSYLWHATKGHRLELALAFLISKAGWRYLRPLLIGLTTGALIVWSKSWPIAARIIMDAIKEAYQTDKQAWLPFTMAYVEQLTGKEFSEEDIAKLAGPMPEKVFIAKIGKEFLYPLLNLIIPEPPLTEDKAWDAAERFLGVNLNFQLSAWVLHLIGDIFSLGHLKSLKDLPNAINWSFGLGWLSWLVMGPVFRTTIVEPMEWDLNQMYRPKLPSITQAARMLIADLIDAADYRYIAARQGYNADFTDATLKLEEAKLELSTLEKFYRLGWLSFDELNQELALKGFSKHRRAFVANYIIAKQRLELIQDIADEAIKAYQDGVIPEATLRAYLEAANYDPQAQDLVIALANLKKARAKKPSDALIKKAYKKGKINRLTAKDMLITRGWDPDWADIYLDT